MPTAHLPPEAFRDLSTDTRASGILAIARQRWTRLGELRLDGTPGLLVLEGIRFPGNLGTILRTAEAVGVAGVAFLDSCRDPYDVAAVRASMGSLYDLRLVRTDAAELIAWARETDTTLVGTSPRAECDHTTLRDVRRAALLMGDEREGLSPDAMQLCDATVRIPICGRGDSLNVAVATGIVLYELLRGSQTRVGQPALERSEHRPTVRGRTAPPPGRPATGCP